MNHKGNLQEFVTITEGKQHEVNEGRGVDFPKGSIVAIDRGYTDYQWYKQLSDKGVYFVTRLKSNAKVRVTARPRVDRKTGLTSDQTAEFTGYYASKDCPIGMRRIGYRDVETGKHYVFLTNSMQEILRLLQTNLFEKRSLYDLITGSAKEKYSIHDSQMAMF
jgi:hypothetical protein